MKGLAGFLQANSLGNQLSGATAVFSPVSRLSGHELGSDRPWSPLAGHLQAKTIFIQKQQHWVIPHVSRTKRTQQRQR